MCKKIETEAFVGCIIETLVIPQGCEVVLEENAFVDCVIYEVQCPKQYEDICKRIFIDTDIIINDEV